MKNLKLFEDFFKFYTYSTVTETKLLWGLTREEVEDLFVEINDYGVSISIDFVYQQNNSVNYQVEDKNVRSLIKRYLKGELTPIIEVNFYNNNRFKGYINDSSEKPEVFDMSFKIDNIVTSLKRTLTDYKIIEGNRSVFFLEEPNSRKRGAGDNRVISIHSDSGVEYGKLFYQITMSRNPYDEITSK